MKSEQSRVSGIAIALLIVGLVIGGSGVYFGVSVPYKQEIRDYESQVEDLKDELADYEIHVLGLAGEISVLETELLEMDGQIDDLLNEVVVLRTEMGRLAGENAQLRVEVKSLQVLLEEELDLSYGSLDTWYHHMDSTEKITIQYDAKVVDGSWNLVDMGNGIFRLGMRWTELNLNEEVEGAPLGTYDQFQVVLDSQDFNAADEIVYLYGDAYWQKIDWEGKIGEWTSSGVEILIRPSIYDPQFAYYQSDYVAGVGLLIYGVLGGGK